MTISARAGTSISMVSAGTISMGSPMKAPAVSISLPMPGIFATAEMKSAG